jgi:CHAD domain-containing protein
MADGKWIQGLTPDMDAAYAARQVLKVRLHVVAEYLPRAVHEGHLDPENVHQLRVGTRRADAALRVFRSCYSGRIYRSARGRLRTIRRAAGAARDWDVFLLAIRERASQAAPGELPGLDYLLGYSQGQRHAAQAQLDTLESQDSFIDFVDRLIGACQSEEDLRLGDLAHEMLVARLQQLEQSASEDLTDYAHLHQVRIAGKRLRYAMEILADCFVSSFRETLYPLVEEMQETLGRANDSHVACDRLNRLRDQLKRWPETWPRLKLGIEALLRYHQRRLPQERRRFVKWWQQWQHAGAETMVAP